MKIGMEQLSKYIDSELIMTNLEVVSKEEAIKVLSDKIFEVHPEWSNGINTDTIYEIIAETKPADIKNILELALRGSFLDARNKLLDIMLKQGLGGLDIIKAVQREIWNLKINEQEKLKLVEKCGETEFRLVEGSDDFIQLEALLASFILAKK